MILASNVAITEFIATQLETGTSYLFKVQARNEFGLSAYSSEILILCAFVPEQPAAPTTDVEGNEAVIEWTAPYDNGTPITSYTVVIRDSLNSYREETANCDGSS